MEGTGPRCRSKVISPRFLPNTAGRSPGGTEPSKTSGWNPGGSHAETPVNNIEVPIDHRCSSDAGRSRVCEFSATGGCSKRSPLAGRTCGYSASSKDFPFLGWKRCSQSTSLDTEAGNGPSPSAFNHCRRQASCSGHSRAPSSRPRSPKGVFRCKALGFLTNQAS